MKKDSTQEQLGPPRFYIALSLGQNKNHALCIIKNDGPPSLGICYIHHCQSIFESYSSTMSRVREIIQEQYPVGRPALIVDVSVVGKAVIDKFGELSDVVSIVHMIRLASGDTENHESGIWRVPRIDLASAIRVLREDSRLVFLSTSGIPAPEHFDDSHVWMVDGLSNAILNWGQPENGDGIPAIALACWAATNPQINVRLPSA